MKCKNCKNVIRDDSVICEHCQTPVSKKKNKLFISLLCILLAVAIAAGSFLTWHFISSDKDTQPTENVSKNSANDSSNKDDENEQGEQDGSEDDNGQNDSDKNKLAALKASLFVDDSDVNINTESPARFSIVLDREITEPIEVVNSDTSEVLTTLVYCTENADGSVEYTGEYNFCPTVTENINIQVRVGQNILDESYVVIHDPVSEEGHEEYIRLMSEFSDYMESLDFRNIDDKAELDIVEEWLRSNDAVASVERTEKDVYYITNGGVMSYHTVEVMDESLLGSAKDDFKENTTAVDYFESWMKDKGSLKLPNGNISYLPADISITNKNSIILLPTRYSNDGFESEMFDDLKNLIENSPVVDGGAVNWIDTPNEFMDALQNHELVNYGAIYWGAHGGIDDEGNYSAAIFNSDNKDSWESFYNDYKSIISKKRKYIDKDGWRILHYTTSKEIHNDDGSVSINIYYKAEISSRYVMELYRDYDLDNPFVFMISCHGLGDTTFNNFLLEHNAQILVGSVQSIQFESARYFIEKILADMYNPQDNESSKMINAFIDDLMNGVYINAYNTYESDEAAFITYGSYANKAEKKNITIPTFEELTNSGRVQNGHVVDEAMIRQYFGWVENVENLKITLYREDTVNENGKARVANTFDASFDWRNTDKIHYLTGSFKDFTFGGSGTLSGVLYKGVTERKIYADGTISDKQIEKGILKNATISANRFLNQGFECEAETASDSNGVFIFGKENENLLPWGHYVLSSAYSSYEGETSIIHTEDSTSGGKFVLNGGKSYLSGFVQGKDGESIEYLKGATVRLVDEYDNEIGSFTTGKDGFFEFKDINEGSYKLLINHKDYESIESHKKIKSGFEYKYQKDIFVLEPNDSKKDIVLVVDGSGSMDGSPMESLKEACKRFANVILDAKKDYRVAMVSYDDIATVVVPFTKYKDKIENAADSLYADGGTNMESGLLKAEELFLESKTKKTIVIMSDGQPNAGKEGQDLINYANQIKNKNIPIYTLGFFDDYSGSDGRALMEAIASYGYHYEASSEEDLVNFFNDMGNQVSDTKKMAHVSVACPVDVYATYKGETLSSASDSFCTRTSFGSLMFDGDESDPVKILRFDETLDVEIRIEGYDVGTMDYSISYVDDEGNYTDVREFKNIKVTEDFVAMTEAKRTDSTTLQIDEDGDGTIDKILEVSIAEEEEDDDSAFYIILIASISGGLVLIVVIIILIKKKNKNKKNMGSTDETQIVNDDTKTVDTVTTYDTKTVDTVTTYDTKTVDTVTTYDTKTVDVAPPEHQIKSKFCVGCGNPLDGDAKFCTKCGRPIM